MYDTRTARMFTYVDSVLADPSMVCYEVAQACKRAKNDYERSLTDSEYPYYFDPEPGLRFEKFCTKFKHIEGPLGGQSFQLMDWQMFVFGQILGWKKKSTDKRRFMEAHIEIPRGNGKSFMASAFTLWMLTMDGESGPQIQSIATSQTQARIVFNKARELLLSNPNFSRWLGCEVRAHEIKCIKEINGAQSFGSYKALSPMGKRLDGLNTHCAIIDELHAIQDPETYYRITTGAGKRPQSLVISITTAGTNRSSIGGLQNQYATDILSGVQVNDSFFCCIWKADDSDPEYSVDTLIKANPSWSVMGQDKMIASMEKAESQASERAAFLTFHLGKWQQSSSSFLDIQRLVNGYDKSLTPEDFKDDPCYIGCDMAVVDDMCVITQCFMRDQKLHVFPKYYLPSETIHSSRNPKYKIWYDQGLLEAIDGPIIEPEVISNEIMKLNEQYDVQWNIIDPYADSSLVYYLNEQGLPVQFADRGWKLSDPTKAFQRLVLTERVRYSSEIFTWNAQNCHVITDRNDNLFVQKKHNMDKIDGIVTVLFCLKYIIDEQVLEVISTFEPYAL